MRRISLHRRAVKYLRRMPRERQVEVVRALEDLAALPKPADHPNVRPLAGEFSGWFRLRVGAYRAIVQARKEGADETIYVDYIGPRGDAY